MDTVVLGPGDIDQAHQPDEYLALDRLTPMIDILKEMINTVCIKSGPLI
jgi:acetylornithine deacetylase